MSGKSSRKQRKKSAGGRRLLEAFTIALGQASDGKWYTSTLELQGACFSVCVACRGVRTLRVIIDKRMPTSLWDDNDPLGGSLQTPETRQLPPLRAAGVDWQMDPDMLVPILIEAELLSGVHWMKIRRVNGASTPLAISRWGDLPLPLTRFAHSPRTYFEAMLTFLGPREDGRRGWQKKLGSIPWPAALRQLSLDSVWDGKHVDWDGLPSSLEQLDFGGYFNQPVESATWPVLLKRLTLGGSFNQPIESATWPVSLQQLTLAGGFDWPIETANWPVALQQLRLEGNFNQPISESASWPTSLLQLTFGNRFNQPIIDVALPASLLELAFGNTFNQEIASVVWPASLLKLTFGNFFNQPMADVVLPASLLELTFGRDFDQCITDVVWPAALLQLTFGHGFNQPVADVVWPSSLNRLIFNGRLKYHSRTWCGQHT